MKIFTTPLPPFFRLLIFAILLIAIGFAVGLPVEAQTSTTTENGTTTEEKKEPPEKPFYQDELDEAFESGYLLGRGGSTVFEDDFNAYNDGDLDGQGGWYGDTHFDVQYTIMVEGAKGVLGTGETASVIIHRTDGEQITDGHITCAMRRDTNSTGNASFYITEDGGQKGHVRMLQDGGFYLYADSPPAWIKIIDYLPNEWYWVQIEWRSSDKDHRARAKIDGGEWSAFTDWYEMENPFSNYIDGVALKFQGQSGTENSFWDYIAEEPFEEEEEMETIELIQNTTTGAEFYLDKTISYGDFLVSTFLLILIIAIIIKIIFDSEIPKRINFKRQ